MSCMRCLYLHTSLYCTTHIFRYANIQTHIAVVRGSHGRGTILAVWMSLSHVWHIISSVCAEPLENKPVWRSE
jgi:hypothetical protein